MILPDRHGGFRVDVVDSVHNNETAMTNSAAARVKRPISRYKLRRIETTASPLATLATDMGMIKLLAAPIRSIVRFPLFQLAVVVAIVLFLQAAEDNSLYVALRQNLRRPGQAH